MATMIGPDEQLQILNDVESGLTVVQIALKFGRAESAIRRLIHKFHPTTVLATKLIRANAIKLAERVVKHATVEESIDVLSRPNIDVLKPNTKESSITGFFTSVSLDSCGAVKEVKGAVIHAVGTGSQIPLQEGNPHETSISKWQGGGSQEHEVGGDPHAGGVQGGPQEVRRRNPRGNPEEPEEKPKKSKKVKANPRIQVVEQFPSRKAIPRDSGKNTDSSIHLRYDI